VTGNDRRRYPSSAHHRSRETRRLRRFLVAACIALLGATTPAAPAAADHSWGGYHWARTSNPFTIKLGDNVSSAWDVHLRTAASDWSRDTAGNPLNASFVAGSTRPRNCKAQSGRVEVCAASYGNNGWLGVAQVWVNAKNHITKGVAKFNDYYYALPKYNNATWRVMVVCQEVGHTFGLDHQDESGADLHTCMDYATKPDADNMHPNAHDYEQLAAIYQHKDASTTIGAAAVGTGRSIGTLRLDTSSFVKSFVNGSKLITFVIWAR
jgi:hypothetical protein